MLEETLQVVHEMWRGDRGSEARFEGRHFRATRLLNSPQAIAKPHPPILVGGGGERKTLRLVAQYADATNVFGGPGQLRHKYSVLRAHCDELGRDYDSIEKTSLSSFSVQQTDGRWNTSEMVDRLARLAEAGCQHCIFSVRDVHDVSRLEAIGREVIPQVRGLGTPSPIP